MVIGKINEGISGGNNAEIGLKLEDIINQSLNWRQSQLGDRDPIRLDVGRLSR